MYKNTRNQIPIILEEKSGILNTLFLFSCDMALTFARVNSKNRLLVYVNDVIFRSSTLGGYPKLSQDTFNALQAAVLTPNPPAFKTSS